MARVPGELQDGATHSGVALPPRKSPLLPEQQHTAKLPVTWGHEERQRHQRNPDPKAELLRCLVRAADT